MEVSYIECQNKTGFILMRNVNLRYLGYSGYRMESVVCLSFLE